MNESWLLFKRNLGDFWRSFRRNRMGMIGAALVLSAILLALFAPLLSPYDPTTVIRDEAGRGLTYAHPSVHGPLGTDDAGRDVWTQLVYGARIFVDSRIPGRFHRHVCRQLSRHPGRLLWRMGGQSADARDRCFAGHPRSAVDVGAGCHPAPDGLEDFTIDGLDPGYRLALLDEHGPPRSLAGIEHQGTPVRSRARQLEPGMPTSFASTSSRRSCR